MRLNARGGHFVFNTRHSLEGKHPSLSLNARGGHFVFNTTTSKQEPSKTELCLNARGGHFVFNTKDLRGDIIQLERS